MEITKYSFPNRTVCSVLEDMREAHKNHNYSYLSGLIEEIQWLANRMEAALGDIKDINRLRENRSKLKEEVRELLNQKKQHTKETNNDS